MAAKLNPPSEAADPDKAAIEASHQRAYAPLGRKRGDLEAVRRRLYQVMWDDVGILRTAEGLARACHELNNLATNISLMGVADPEKRYNLTWMDRLNLENLVLTSRAICAAAQTRTDSRGAHYREDFPETSALSSFPLHRRPRLGRRLQGRDRAGRFHPRQARPIAVAAGGGIRIRIRLQLSIEYTVRVASMSRPMIPASGPNFRPSSTARR